MSKNRVLTCAVVVLLAASLYAAPTVLLDETFSGDSLNTTTWKPLTTIDDGTATISVADGQMTITTSVGAKTDIKVGIQSTSSFQVPEGQMLVVDYYGTNSNAGTIGANLNSIQSCPLWVVGAHQSTGKFDAFWAQNYAGLVGSSGGSYYPGSYETLNWNDASGSRDALCLGEGVKLTYAQAKHVIFTINASEVNLYVADDYFENLSNPTAVKTWSTAEIFTPAQLQAGLYVYALMASSNKDGERFESFDGVKVSTVPEPASLVLLATGAAALIRKSR